VQILRIISQNITNYGIEVPDDTIFRINLAWCDSIDDLRRILEKHNDDKIFLDLPTKRVKPPNNKYTIDDLVPIIERYKQIKYFAISNVESSNDLDIFLKKIPRTVILVPKIESPNAVENIANIVSAIPTKEKIVMLDHDDLFSKLIKNNEVVENFKIYIKKLVDYCNTNNIVLLRTIGVVFSDEEKRVSQYIK
jgi:citrate lyase beta subunit